MKVKLVVDVLRMATSQLKPNKGSVVNTDSGSQYASREYPKLLNAHGPSWQYEQKRRLLG
jgi:putative transposase